MNKSNIIKNLLFSLFCFLITAILITGLIFPQIKTYKKLLYLKQNQERINNEHKSQENDLQSKLDTFIQENQTMINKYKTQFNEEDFKKLCLKFFNTAKLQYEQTTKAEKYQKYTLKVSTNIDSPVNFYDFVKALYDYSNIIKVDFPIGLKSKGNELEAVFNIKVFVDSLDK